MTDCHSVHVGSKLLHLGRRFLPHTASWQFQEMLKTEGGKGFVGGFHFLFFLVQDIQICYPKCPGKGQ